MTRRVVLRGGEDGYWIVACPSLPPCISQGETKEEAIEPYLEVLQDEGRAMP